MRLVPALGLVLSLLVCAAAAQPPELRDQAYKLHPYLRQQLTDAAPGDRLPVYFVLRDRLGYHSWYPRVQRLDAAARRALVVRELREHAARCQRPLLAALDHAARDLPGSVRDMKPQWLANVVFVRATRAAIARALALDCVWEVWADHAPPRHEVEDALPPQGGAGAGNAAVAVGADRCWALGYTGQGVVVLNADSGINVQHQALANRLWANPGEIPANGIDDDNNGLVDDVHGWNFGRNNKDIEDGGGHGTQTAGCLVADGSCFGTTYGVAPGGRVATAKLLSEGSQWASVQYALDEGIPLHTSSWSFRNSSYPEPNYRVHRDVAEASLAAGLTRTNSTSNNGGNCNGTGVLSIIARPFNVSVPGNMPAPYLDPAQTLVGRKGGVIGVGAYDVRDGSLDPFSPCGPSAWDLGDLLAVLPGYNLFNWDPADNDYPWNGGARLGLLKPDVLGPTYTDTSASPGATCNILQFGGTSNATPVVMGCLMLWYGANPSLTPEDLAMVLHQTADDFGTVPGKENTYGAGRVDAFAGLHRALAVHRVNGDSGYRVTHRSGAPLSFELDGLENRVALIALNGVRQTVALPGFTSHIGCPVVQVVAGTTGASGDALRLAVPVPAGLGPVTVFSQAWVDDRAGATGRILESNVVEVVITP